MVLAAVLGEWLCLQRELQEIPIGAGVLGTLLGLLIFSGPRRQQCSGELLGCAGKKIPMGEPVLGSRCQVCDTFRGEGEQH